MQGDAVSRTCVCFWVSFLREDEASKLRGVWVHHMKYIATCYS